MIHLILSGGSPKFRTCDFFIQNTAETISRKNRLDRKIISKYFGNQLIVQVILGSRSDFSHKQFQDVNLVAGNCDRHFTLRNFLYFIDTTINRLIKKIISILW